jgi:hypothetical protein
MKRTEKIIAAVLTMVVGVLLIVMKDKFIGVLTTVIGLGLIVFGIVDIIGGGVPPAVVKMVGGLLVILCGWLVVEAVLYLLSAVTLILGILILYDKIKGRACGNTWWNTALAYAPAGLCIAIGLLLLFHKCLSPTLIFIGCGIFALIEGGILLFNVFWEEE